MLSTFRTLYFALTCIVLTACGGGGGSSSDNGPQLSLLTTSVSFSGSIDQIYPEPQTITGTILRPGNETYYIYVELESTDVIENASVDISGTTGYLTLFPRNPDEMQPGMHQETIRVLACTNSSCTSQLAGSPKSITVNYEVLYDPSVADRDDDGLIDNIDPFPQTPNQAPVFSLAEQYFGDAGQPFVISGSTITSDPDSPIASYRWEQIQGEPMLFTPIDEAQLSLVLPTGEFAEPNIFRLTVTDEHGASSYSDIDIEVIRPISYLVENSSIGGYTSTQSSATFNIDIVAHEVSEWQLGSISEAIEFSQSEGTGNAVINGTVHFSELSTGSNDLVIDLIDVRQQVTHQIPIRVTARADRPVVVKNGIALTQAGNVTRLSANVTVNSESGDELLNWSASSNQPWLSLSSTNGQAGSGFTVTADPSGLENGLHRATISLTSPGSDIPETVSVGLYVSDGATGGQTNGVASTAMEDMAADPTRPYVYTVGGNANIYVYDLHAAQETASHTIGGSLNSIAVSNDGERIFVFDSTAKRIFVVNSSTFAIENEFDLASVLGTNGRGLEFIRPEGMGMLFVGGQSIVDAASGDILHEGHLYHATTYVSDEQDRALQSYSSASNYYQVYLITLDVAPLLGTVQPTSEFAFEVSGGYGFPVDFASTRDLSTVWVSTGAQVRTYSYNTQDGFQLLSDLSTWQGWQNALEAGPNYDSYYLGQDYDDVNNVCAYDTILDSEQGCINPPSRDVAIRMLKLSSDGLRGMVLSDPDYGENVQPVTFFDTLH